MNHTAPLTAFFRQVPKNSRLLPSHISLYMALVFCYQKNGFEKPFTVYRKDLMKLSRIASTATYHKCLRELVCFGYVTYKPSYNYYEGSMVSLPEMEVSV